MTQAACVATNHTRTGRSADRHAATVAAVTGSPRLWRRLFALPLLAGAVFAVASQAGGQDDPGTLTDTLTEQNWFVDDVQEADGRTTVTFAWTDSYFAARACQATLSALDGAEPATVSVIFGGSEARTCAQLRANPAAAIWTPPVDEAAAGDAPAEPSP